MPPSNRSLTGGTNDGATGGGGGGGSGGGTSSGGLALGTPVAPPAGDSPVPTFGGSASGGAGGGLGGGATGGAGAGVSSSGSGTAVTGDAGPTPSGAGILTAGVWDDGLNYSFFSTYAAGKTGLAGSPNFASTDLDAAHTEFEQRTAHTVIDAALVIDTTGSMGDELSYLTSEFAAISASIAASFPNADQRWALVVYRDTPDTDPGDAYVVKSYDFTGDLTAFATTVGSQQAANGGDYPESPEQGLGALPQLSWRTGASVAKVAFWVADAPQHDYRGPQMKAAIQAVQGAGVHVYPVSASGTNDLLELTMRTTAEMTGGRYLFLTNDSGVGDPHKIPEIPCYYVTLLKKALVRVASMELSGTYVGPDPADVIRISGDASPDGTCSTGDDAGTRVQIF